MNEPVYHVVREGPKSEVLETLGVTPEFEEARQCAIFWLDYFNSTGLRTDNTGTVSDADDYFLFQIRLRKQ